MSELKERIARLSPARLALLAQRLGKGSAPDAGPPPIPRRPEAERAAPLSFAQERLWFLHRLEPESVVYNIARAIRLRGRVERQVFEQCFNEIVRRHDILRTTFAEHDGEPAQTVAPHTNVSIPVVDLSGLSAPEREAAARAAAAEEAARPFDLVNGPLYRISLLRLGEEEHVALFTLHHIVSDAWSTAVLVKELVALYGAFARGEASPLAPLPIQYADFAGWQRGWLRGAALEELLGYWRRQLAGAPPVLSLPTDGQRRHAPGGPQGARLSRTLPQALAVSVQTLSLKEKATLFTTLLALFNVLMHHYSAQEDIVVGSPIANRNRAEVEGLIGFFVNTLALRTDLSGNPTFRELLGRVREMALGAYAHQDVPFAQVVKAVQSERTLSHTPLFQVVFHMNNVPTAALELPGLTLAPVEGLPVTVPFDLVMHAANTDAGLRLTLDYKPELFSAATAARMLAHYEGLLARVVSDPDATVGDLRAALALEDERARAEREQELAEVSRQKFMTTRRKAVVAQI
ncbi:MAG TPA: condensation domain-containing protein [Pyrinomonadaceae bacterium]|nr:condensation domain-containing protein [Pyrinomonadaceae bacterium]